MKKGTKNFTPLPPRYSIPFLSVLGQNKALFDFHKRGHRLIVERNIGLEFSIPVHVINHTFLTWMFFLWSYRGQLKIATKQEAGKKIVKDNNMKKK